MIACNADGNYGDRSLDRCQAKAEGDIILFCDDDDVYTEGALDRIRAWAAANPGKIGIFRRRFNSGEKQWRHPELYAGNVQRMCIALPNVQGKLPTWTGYETEISIPQQAAALQSAAIEFVDDVIGLARPFEAGVLGRLRYKVRLRTRIQEASATLKSSMRAAGRA